MSKFIFWFATILLFISAAILFVLDVDMLRLSTSVEFEIVNPVSNQSQTVEGNIVRGSRPFGVIIVGDFGSNNVNLKNITKEYSDSGFHVMTFKNFEKSVSQRTMKNIAEQTQIAEVKLEKAVEVLKAETNIEDSDILMIGHGFGGRVVLQYLSEKGADRSFLGSALISPLINLDSTPNTLYFSALDDKDMDWIKNLSSHSLNIPTLLIASSTDDIVTPTSITKLYNKLSGDEILSAGNGFKAEKNGVKIRVFDNAFHAYQMNKNSIIDEVKNWTTFNADVYGMTSFNYFPTIRVWLWFSGFIGIILMLVSVYKMSLNKYIDVPYSTITVSITTPIKYLAFKFGLWIAAIPIMAIIYAVLYILPTGLPMLNTYYICIISGYGILMFVLYLLGVFPQTKGRLEIQKPKIYFLRTLLTLLIMVTLVGIILYFFQTGIYDIGITNDRIICLIIFTMLTSLWFYTNSYEGLMLERDEAYLTTKVIYFVIQYLPFLMAIPLYWLLGIYSSFINTIINFAILISVILLGKTVRVLSGNSGFASISSSLIFNLLIVLSSVLI